MKKTYDVELVGGTVNYVGRDSFCILTNDLYVYRIDCSDKKLFSLDPRISEVVWLYRIKTIHKVIDILLYEDNPDLDCEPYQIEVEEK